MGHVFDLPFVLAMGPQRCGTSALERYLDLRGDVCLPAGVNEIFFFDRHFQRGAEFYASHFQPSPAHKIMMEVTTTAFDNSLAPARVYDIAGPDIRLICPLRHPVTRSCAVYADYINYGIVTGSLREAVEQAPQIVFASRYATHLEPWIETFGKEAIHFVFFEDLHNRTEHYIENLCRGLGLPAMNFTGDPDWRRDSAASLNALTLVPISESDKLWLASTLSREKEKLEALTGLSLSFWD